MAVGLALIIGFITGLIAHRAGFLQWLRGAIIAEPLDLSDSYMHQLKVPLHRAFPTQAEIVMVGDSLTETANWSAFFPDLSIANYGVAGDTSFGMLKRLDTIIATGAKRAFLMLGINDVRRGIPAEATINNVRQLIEALRTAGMSVFVQSTLFTDRQVESDKIQKLNVAFSGLCQSGLCTFVDLNTAISNDGTLRPEFVFDGLHVNFSAYIKWRDIIAPYLKQ